MRFNFTFLSNQTQIKLKLTNSFSHSEFNAKILFVLISHRQPPWHYFDKCSIAIRSKCKIEIWFFFSHKPFALFYFKFHEIHSHFNRIRHHICTNNDIHQLNRLIAVKRYNRLLIDHFDCTFFLAKFQWFFFPIHRHI